MNQVQDNMSNKSFQLEENINELSSILDKSIADLYSGNVIRNEYEADIVVVACNLLVNTCDQLIYFLREDIVIKFETVLIFLKSILPKYVEIFLRRRSQREHEHIISLLFYSVTNLLAQTFCQKIVELCELRNILFVNGVTTTFKFVTMKELKLNTINFHYNSQSTSSSNMLGGFFNNFGKITSVYKSKSEILNFWPDEWEKSCGGYLSIGHFVEVYFENEREWRVGEILSYNIDDDKYIIRFDVDLDDLKDKIPKEANIIPINLRLSIHNWVDLSNRHRISFDQLGNVSSLKLSMSISDKDLIVKVLLLVSAAKASNTTNNATVSQLSYYGRILEYDSKSDEHIIIFENGDIKQYYLPNLTYEIININHDIYRKIKELNNDNLSILTLVSNWHKSFSNREPTKNNTSILRPIASKGFTLSYHYIEILKLYFEHGGSENMFNWFSSTTTVPPASRIILLNLQFIFQLRNILPTSLFRDFVWDVKEAVPFTFSRYEDAQFKDLVYNDLVDIFLLLKDLVEFTNSIDLNSFLSGLDELRLNLALRLLRCSQIQKRYLGLNMIKEVIESISPKLSVYTSKRVHYLKCTNNGRFVQPINNSLLNSIQADNNKANPTRHLFATSMTKDKMLDWLIKNQFIHDLFGDSIHQDLISKSELILAFMAYYRSLSETHTEIICLSCRRAHEAVVKVIHQLILLLVPLLDPNLRIKLFSQITNISMNEYNESFMLLIKAYTVQVIMKTRDIDYKAADNNGQSNSSNYNGGNSVVLDSLNQSIFSLNNRKGLVYNTPTREWLGFGILWQFIQDPITPVSASITTSVISNIPSSSCSEILAYTQMYNNNNGNADSLVDLAVQLLVELLEVEFIEERERVMQRCIEHVRIGVSVPVSLQLLRRTLGTYPNSAKSWYASSPGNSSILGSSKSVKVSTLSGQIEIMQKNDKLLDVIFMDIERFRSMLLDQVEVNSVKPASSNNLQNLVNPESDESGFNAEMESLNNTVPSFTLRFQIKAISERLDFLQFILSNSNLCLNEKQMSLLWVTFAENAVSIECFELFIDWLNNLMIRESKSYSNLLQSLSTECDPVNTKHPSKLAFLWNDLYNDGVNQGSQMSSAFDENVLIKLYEKYAIDWLTKKAKIKVFSRLSVASLFIKMFLLANITNRAIRVEPDGVWYRVGPLTGLVVLWRLALDSIDIRVSNAAISLIVELHHRLQTSYRVSSQLRSYLMNSCFNQISMCVQSLRTEDIKLYDLKPVNTMISNPQNQTAQSRLVIDGEGYPLSVQVNSQHSVLNRSVNRFPDTPNFAIVPGQDDWCDYGDVLVDSVIITTRIARFISLIQLFIQRFQKFPLQMHTVRILAGREDNVVLNLTMLSNDTVGSLRRRIAAHFKEPAEAISLVHSPLSNVGQQKSLQVSTSSKSTSTTGAIGAIWNSIATSSAMVRLEKDDITLRQAKFNVIDTVLAKKKDPIANTYSSASIISDPNKVNDDKACEDFIIANDLFSDIFLKVTPLTWISDSSQEEVTNSIDSAQVYTALLFPLSRQLFTSLVTSNISTSRAVSASTNDSNGSFDSSEYLGHVLQKLPNYIDQLLEILDGYLSAEIKLYTRANHKQSLAQLQTFEATNDSIRNQPAYASNDTSPQLSNSTLSSDLSSSIWEVVQSLPLHSGLFQQIRHDLIQDITGATLRRLLDYSSPYRLLYSLQIIDCILNSVVSFVGTRNDSTMSSSELLNQRQPSSSLEVESGQSYGKSLENLDWTIKFVSLGGVEHIVTLVNHFLDSSRLIDTALDSGRAISTIHDSAVLTEALLVRILHYLLLLDPFYQSWQSQIYKIDAYNSPPGNNHSKIPSGIVLACLDIPVLCNRLCLYTYNISAATFSNEIVTSSTLQTLSEHVLVIVFALMMASDGSVGLEHYLTSQLSFHRWIFQLCVLENSYAVRAATCRRIFESLANINSTIQSKLEIQQQKLSHLSHIFNYFYDLVLMCCSDCLLAINKSNANVPNHQTKELLSLFSSLSSLQYCSERIFASSDGLNHSGNPVSSQDKLDLGTALMARNKTTELTNQQEAFHSNSTSLSSRTLINEKEKVCADREKSKFILIYIFFIDALTSHASCESFHSHEVDGTLVGLLRVLLVLSSSSKLVLDIDTADVDLNSAEDILSNLSVDSIISKGSFLNSFSNTSDERTTYISKIFMRLQEKLLVLIEYLYHQCLFPPELSDQTTSNSSLSSGISFQAAKCETWESRDLVYTLLYQLCRNNEMFLGKLGMVMSNSYAINISLDFGEFIWLNSFSDGKYGIDMRTDVSHPMNDDLSTRMIEKNLSQRKVEGESYKFFDSNRQTRKTVSRSKTLRWGYNPNLLAKEKEAYVGLVNQGGTCYMNSFVQQLFHLPHFSNQILSVQLSNVSRIDSDDNSADVNENDCMIFQLQVMFGYLRLSQKSFYDTMGFCRAFKDYNGQAISLVEQKDINEFAGMLFDKLESHPECRQILADTIQGKVVWKTRSVETSYQSDREESFYMITAEVKGKSTLADSLDLFIAEELFSGENKIEDSIANRKVDALRRCAIRELPSTLIIHLKRFEFDLETMDRKKVNDLLSFPMLLNMFPYTEEGILMKEQTRSVNYNEDTFNDEQINFNIGASNLETEVNGCYKNDTNEDLNESGFENSRRIKLRAHNYYNYELIGIVAHVGAIDRGHYYSFIKTSALPTDDENVQWYEFNDRNVYPFNPDCIPHECFGGEETVQSSAGSTVVRMKQHNAYLLIYQRIQQDNSHKVQTYNANNVGCHDIREISNAGIKEVDGLKDNTNLLVLAEDGASSSQVLMSSLSLSQESDVSTPAISHVSSPTVSSHSINREVISVDKLDALSMPVSSSVETAESVDISVNNFVGGLSSGLPWHFSAMSPAVLQAVWLENTEFQTDRYIHSVTHFRFMWQLLFSDALNRLLSLADIHKASIPKLQDISQGSTSVAFSSVDPIAIPASEDEVITHIHATATINFPQESCSLTSSQVLYSPDIQGDSNKTLYNTNDQTDINENLLILPRIVLIELKFILETISCSKTTGCLPVFFARIVEILRIDNTGYTAFAILRELARWQEQCNKGCNGIAQVFEDPIALSKQYNQLSEDLNLINDYCHSWLVLVFIHCPVTLTVKMFSKLLISCFKRLKCLYSDWYFASLNVLTSTGQLSSSGISHNNNENTSKQPTTIEPSSSAFSVKSSIPVVVVNMLLVMLEKFPSDYILGKVGLSMLSQILHQFAMFGYEERLVLLRLQAIFRLVCMVLSLSSCMNRIPSDHIAPLVDLLALLIRSAAVPNSSISEASVLELTKMKSTKLHTESMDRLRNGKSIFILDPVDVQAFLNKVFLDTVIPVNPTSIVHALIHISQFSYTTHQSDIQTVNSKSFTRNKEATKIFEFLLDKVEENIILSANKSNYNAQNQDVNQSINNSSGSTSSIVNLLPYFNVLSDMLVFAVNDVEVLLTPVLELVIPHLLQKVEIAAARRGTNDQAFVYLALKLVQAIGMSNMYAHNVVMNYNDVFRRLRIKLSQNKRDISQLPTGFVNDTVGQANNVGNSAAKKIS